MPLVNSQKDNLAPTLSSPREGAKLDLSIIILVHNSKEDLKRLLPGVFGSEGVSFESGKSPTTPPRPLMQRAGHPSSGRRGEYSTEVIVVDKGSDDNSSDFVLNLALSTTRLALIRNQNNGFAAGNNIGIRQARGKYLLILNPDTELKPDTLQVMLEFMEAHQAVGISTCKVLLPNGKLDLACRRRFPNPWNGFKRLFLKSKRDYNYTDIDENQSMEIDSCMGAFMLIRRIGKSDRSENRISDQSDSSDFSGFPKFDEDFFMYGEDIDLCWRVKEAGYKVWYYPKTSITHYKGSSSRKASYQALKWFHDAMWVFYKKHYEDRYPFIFNWLVWLGISSRLLMLIALNFFRSEKFVSQR